MSSESRVVVTGASAGIGLAESVQFAAQGDTLVASMLADQIVFNTDRTLVVLP